MIQRRLPNLRNTWSRSFLFTSLLEPADLRSVKIENKVTYLHSGFSTNYINISCLLMLLDAGACNWILNQFFGNLDTYMYSCHAWIEFSFFKMKILEIFPTGLQRLIWKKVFFSFNSVITHIAAVQAVIHRNRSPSIVNGKFLTMLGRYFGVGREHLRWCLDRTVEVALEFLFHSMLNCSMRLRRIMWGTRNTYLCFVKVVRSVNQTKFRIVNIVILFWCECLREAFYLKHVKNIREK